MGEQFPGSRPLIPVNIRDPRYSNIHLGGKGAWWNIAVHSGLHISLVRLRLTTFRCLPLLSLSRSFCVYIYIHISIISLSIFYIDIYFTHKKAFAQMGSQVPSIGTVKTELPWPRTPKNWSNAPRSSGAAGATLCDLRRGGAFFPPRCGHDFLLWWDGLVFFLVNSCFRVRKRKKREEEIDSRKNKFL